MALLLIYLSCTFYNALWLLFPHLGLLSNVMKEYSNELKAQNPESSLHELLGDLYVIYFLNKDLKVPTRMYYVYSHSNPELYVPWDRVRSHLIICQTSHCS